MTLADIFSAIDSAKRRGAGLLGGDGQTATDLATGMGRALLTTPADIGQQFANFIQGNPGNVLGQPQGMDQIRGLLGSPTSDAQDVGEAIGPPMKLAGKALGLLSGKLPAMLAAHIAYHGTPFDVDKFSSAKIGTGEGAQVYGHGLYFAENPQVAQQYANGVLDMPKINDINAQLAQLNKIMEADSKYPGAYRQFKSDAGAQAAQQYDDLMTQKMKPGNLYKVDINADPAHYLDWDAPLSEQSPHVQNAIASLPPMQWVPGKGIQGVIAPDADHTGEAIYRQVVNSGPSNSLSGDQEHAAQTLRDLGIPGIKYKDAGSRAGDGGTHNYVVFDDSLINNLGAAP